MAPTTTRKSTRSTRPKRAVNEPRQITVPGKAKKRKVAKSTKLIESKKRKIGEDDGNSPRMVIKSPSEPSTSTDGRGYVVPNVDNDEPFKSSRRSSISIVDNGDNSIELHR